MKAADPGVSVRHCAAWQEIAISSTDTNAPVSPAPREPAAVDPLARLRLLVEAALDKKATDVVVLDLGGKTSFCDYFVLCSGNSPRHVRAIATHMREHLRKERGLKPLGYEGLETGKWALLDYDDVLVHVFEEKARVYYDLEGLWMDAGRVSLESLGLAAPAPPSDAEYAAQLP